MKVLTLTVAGLALAGSTRLAAAQGMPSPEEMKCTALLGMSVTPGEIGLPTTGADIYDAVLVKGEGGAGGGFCKVRGGIDPVDPAAPDINFEVNLPLEWNHKALQFGGGGYDGTLVTATGHVSFGEADVSTPLERGYATFGSDSGHQLGIIDGSFMMNDEALANYGGAQIKKTHDVAMAVIAAYYDAAPKLTYIQGNSQGGHESLIGIQRWPDDYDGALVTHPANPLTELQLSGNYVSQALYQPGGYMNAAKIELLNSAVYAACDGLDGLKDGLIGNILACNATFDVQSLRCPSGDDEGDGCLSDAQIKVLNTLDSPYTSPVAVEDEVTGFPKWPIYQGADLYGIWSFGLSPEPQNPPAVMANFALAVFADQLIRYAIVRDPSFNSLTFNAADYAARIREVSKIVDANKADLTPFVSHGGKMLMMHGTVDFAISPYNTIRYYSRVVEAMGADKVHDFMRFYLVPGFGHGSGRFIAAWDPLTALENWVENGKAPENLVVTDAGPDGGGRSRPLCEYPGYPAYNVGASDPSSAASFHCAK